MNILPFSISRRLRVRRERRLLEREGLFSYKGEKVAFPRGHHLLGILQHSGDFEPQYVELFCRLGSEKKTAFDVGANVGLYSISLLKRYAEASVIAVECSPQTLPFLERTHSLSEFKPRWQIAPLAVSDCAGGTADFYAGEVEEGVFDGLRDTGRGGAKSRVQVPITTLDQIWADAGRPHVSIIKMDIEGGESAALRGAMELIESQRPFILMEWNAENLSAWGVDKSSICRFKELDYGILAVPQFWEIDSSNLEAAMKLTQMFLLYPKAKDTPNFVPKMR